MNFHQHFTVPGTPGFNPVPLINVVFLVVVFIVVAPLLSSTPPMNVRLPGALTSDVVNGDNMTIIVSGENVFSYNNRVVTLGELRAVLAGTQNHQRGILIKADRRASMGRIVDLWNLGRSLGVERINVASDREE